LPYLQQSLCIIGQYLKAVKIACQRVPSVGALAYCIDEVTLQIGHPLSVKQMNYGIFMQMNLSCRFTRSHCCMVM